MKIAPKARIKNTIDIINRKKIWELRRRRGEKNTIDIINRKTFLAEEAFVKKREVEGYLELGRRVEGGWSFFFLVHIHAPKYIDVAKS